MILFKSHYVTILRDRTQQHNAKVEQMWKVLYVGENIAKQKHFSNIIGLSRRLTRSMLSWEKWLEADSSFLQIQKKQFHFSSNTQKMKKHFLLSPGRAKKFKLPSSSKLRRNVERHLVAKRHVLIFCAFTVYTFFLEMCRYQFGDQYRYRYRYPIFF